MNCLAGIDEAGLGPILGPMVVAGCALTGPEGSDPWKLLRRHVSRRNFQKGKVRVADSKKVNTGAQGLRHLEETALCFWGVLHGALPGDLAGWLTQLGCDLDALEKCPWYDRLDLPLPLHADADWLELQSELVARQMARSDVAMRTIAVRPVDVEEWNGLIADTDNKSRAHFRAYAEVLSRLLDAVPGSGHLVADRCGGRMHYRRDLELLRPGVRVEVVQEEPAASVYRLGSGDEIVQVTFAEKGDDRSFPTALASCFAKYLRELMVHVLNDWFCERVPGLKRTAGYYVDGHRFLAELEPHMPALAVRRELLVRVR
ncbi:MAG: hypothetical protein AB7O97_04590 [Planctomycetota bacterium]